eukprot:2156868-Pleurochrysis_carterae.AAC.1
MSEQLGARVRTRRRARAHAAPFTRGARTRTVAHPPSTSPARAWQPRVCRLLMIGSDSGPLRPFSSDQRLFILSTNSAPRPMKCVNK